MPAKGVYFFVKGSSSYFNVSLSAPLTSGQIIVPVQLPSGIGVGSFTVQYYCYDSNGGLTNGLSTVITVSAVRPCNTSISGGSGIIISTHSLGVTPGTVSISYDMSGGFRMDIFSNNQWIAGTGTSPANGIPPASNCSSGPANGYTGGKSSFSFAYNPGSGPPNIQVYLSGCLDSTHEWVYTVSCPK